MVNLLSVSKQEVPNGNGQLKVLEEIREEDVKASALDGILAVTFQENHDCTSVLYYFSLQVVTLSMYSVKLGTHRGLVVQTVRTPELAEGKATAKIMLFETILFL